MNELDTSCETSLAALQLIANGAAAELGSARGNLNESTPKVATKFLEVTKVRGNMGNAYRVAQVHLNRKCSQWESLQCSLVRCPVNG